MTIQTGTRNALLLALGLAVATVPLAAEARGDKGARINFEQLDADANGEITQAEIEAHRNARFAAADTDGDGALSREELVAQGEARKAERATRRLDRMMERLDANDDGKLSAEELAARGEGRRGDMFERLDADNSGSISKAEFEDAKMKRKGKRGHGSKDKN